MRTTFNLPEELLNQACRISGAKTKTQAIVWGLHELMNKKKTQRLWGLRGKLPLALDLKKSRAR
ncbi:MAG: type II toxin-antitoxin system VapB family antitoxin [Elusimicrobia bacterium]|nr:type II toxin-antitoxin system VapB family antitoxin [Elusimicrobiota bacterium]